MTTEATDEQAGPPTTPTGSALSAPVAPRRPHRLEAHGDTWVDDWYWLRERENPDVLALLEAENEHTAAALSGLEGLEEQVYADVLGRILLTDVTYPTPRGPWAYYSRTIEGLEHSIVCRRPVASPPPSRDPAGGDPDEVVVLDENRLAEGHDYYEVGEMTVSTDHRLLAYAEDTTGGEVMTVRFRDLEAAEGLADSIEGAHYGLAFSADGRYLFYTRPDEAMRPYQVWRHELGTAQDQDALVLEEGDERFFLNVETTKDRRFVVLSAESSVTTEVRLVPADEPLADPVVVSERRQGVTYSVEHHDGTLLVLSNEDAVNFALWATPVGDLRRDAWRLLLPHRDDVRIDDLDVLAGWAIVSERHRGTTSLRLVALEAPGDSHEPESRIIEAPEAGTIRPSGNGDFEATAVRFETTSLVQPRTLHELDLASGETSVLWSQTVPGFDPSLYRTERRWAVSQDGTKVPLTLAWRADRPAGPGSCFLMGYGSYEFSLDPVFSADRTLLPLLDRGVLCAIAHVRGGGELGRRWYLDGKLEHKHHSFEDFVACGRLLVDEGLTTESRLAAWGRSAGGLLVGASVNLDPGLFGAVVAQVPFVDCLTTMLDRSLPLTVTEGEEWGDPVADEAAYRRIRAYAPYDNVREGVRYPLVLATSGVNDTRVGYFEPAKWVQKLRASNPEHASRVLLRLEMSAGHFGSSGRYQTWRQWAFVLTFVLAATGAVEAGGVFAS